jgi:hypothetical protein
MALTTEEKGKVRAALGYPQVSSAGALSFGIPINLQMNFMVENAMTRLMPDAEPRVRQILGFIDRVELQQQEATCTANVESVGDVRMRPGDAGKSTFDLLAKERYRWCKLLADIFGVPLYNFSSATGGGGQVKNARVRR